MQAYKKLIGKEVGQFGKIDNVLMPPPVPRLAHRQIQFPIEALLGLLDNGQNSVVSGSTK
jgi:hypothetical protein